MRITKCYFSSWIENLGVVPLFRFLAFLFWPIFVFLLFLLASVTAVFETMIKFLTKIVNLLNNPKYLPPLQQTVKMLFTTISILPILAVGGDNLLISKGEIKEIKVENLEKFSVGNPEIVSGILGPGGKTLLIKGKMLGYTELKIWAQSGKNSSYQINVISKKRHLTLSQILETLRGMGLKTSLYGTLISAEGTLKRENDRQILLLFLKKNPHIIDLKVELSDELKNLLYQKILGYFSKSNLGQMECQTEFIDVICLVPKSDLENLELKKYLSNKFGIKFITRDQIDFSNYLFKLKIIQIEKQNGETIGLNLDQGTSSIKDLFKVGLKQYLDLNKFNFKSSDFEISTLAEPEIITLIGQKVSIEIGAEISFPSQDKDKSPNWKFAGIRTDFELQKVGNLFQLNYKTQMTKPNGDTTISGNKESASAMIELDKPIQLFQIGFKTEGKNSEGLPIIKNIPILREIFGTTANQSTYKRITGFLVLEEYGNTKK